MSVILIILGRAFYIQVLQPSNYKQIALQQQYKVVTKKARRGTIFDRNGEVLATNIFSRSFAVNPKILIKDSLSRLRYYQFEKVLNTSWDSKKIGNFAGKSFVWLVRGLYDYPKIADTFDFAGLIKLSEPRRLYPFGKIASNVLGYANIDNKGLSGLEYYFDSVLRGKDEKQYILQDAWGNVIPLESQYSVKVVDGSSIRITIDINLQQVVEYFLEKGVKETRSNFGCAVVLNPNNGEILALANYPNFDPNSIRFTDNTFFQNYAVSYAFEPGSTIKPIIAALALQKKLISTTEIFAGFKGALDIGDFVIKDDHPLPKATLSEAIVYSSNIVFAQVATRFNSGHLIQSLRNFGFGEKTQITLPGESRGKLKSLEELTPTLQKFLGFGYGLSVTPIQLAIAYSALANGGLLLKPKLVFETIPTDKNLARTSRRVLDSSVAQKITEMLIDVVEFGTASSTKIEGIKIAGKTGTSQKFVNGEYSKTRYINTFVGYLPAEKPKILIVIMLDEPKISIYASETVVPIFRDIVLSMLNSKIEALIYN
ncbi:MAG: penicillin-binding protein 2 [Ignavibacteria bacterium]|nr:penicillin-binding protein 2 [Ignavibacteria bacterium]